MKSLSVIVPVFNEEKRISTLINEINLFPWQKYFSSAEFIIVDDGSKDSTRNIIQNFNSIQPLKVISYLKNMGKGYALRQGVAAAANSYCLLADVDLSVSFNEIEKFISHIEFGSPIIIGSRKNKDAHIIKPQSWLRQRMGEGYTKLANLILEMNISDFTCGFKIIESKTAKDLFSGSVINSWSYDPEILFLASKSKIPILEIPVFWQNDSRTKVNLLRDVLKELINLIFIRFRR